MIVPFDQQHLSRDFVENIKLDRARGLTVAGDDLLHAVEQRIGPLPLELRQLFSSFSIPAVRQRGRPANDRGVEDFGLEELDKRYAELLLEYQAAPRMQHELSPSDRAYERLATEMKGVFGNIDRRALSNKHSAWKTGRFHRTGDGLVDSDDFDTEIDRQFPAHK